MPRILILPKWYPNLNDVQHGIFIKNQALALAKFAEVGVLFVVTSDQIVEDKIEIERNGNYFSLTYYFPKKSNRLFALYSYYKSFAKAKLKFESEWGKADIALLYILGRNYWFYKKYYTDIPFVVSEQWSGYLNGGMERYIYAKRKNTVNALKKASAIIAVSVPLANALKQYSGNSTVAVIPNIVLSKAITANQPKEIIHVLTVADLDDQIKNISGMIQALSIASKETAFHLTIIGEGKDEVSLKKLASEKSNDRLMIEFKNRMPHEKLLEQYSNCHFYLLNSPTETFCVAAAEAVAAGRPVVATRCGGPEKYLNDQNSLFTITDHPQKLAETIQLMVEKLKNGQFLAEKVAETVRQQFGADTIAKQYLDILEATINKKNG